MRKRTCVWVWIKPGRSCRRSFEDARSVWPRYKPPRHGWSNAKPKPIGSGDAIRMISSVGGDGAGRPFKQPFGEPEPKAQDNFTDPESRIMKMGTAFEQGYNAQAAVDADSQLIIANGLTANAADNGELLPMIEAVENNLGQPQRVLADSGYRSEQAFVALEQMGVEALVALGREGKNRTAIDRERYPASARMAERLASAEGQGHYRRRKVIPEPVFGWIKHIIGFRQFSFRGLTKVSGEWNLVCLAINVRRMRVLQGI